MIRTALLSTALTALALAASAHAADLAVTVHDVHAQSGTLRAHFTFKGVPAGNYAVLLTHDENDNGKLDTNLVGMPVEGYGFSNNPQVMRKPTFDEARVDVPAAGTAIDITLR